MIIGVDLDDTWLGWSHWYDGRLDTVAAHLPGIPRSKDRTTFDLWTGRTDEEKEAILSIMDEEDFYDSLEPVDGAVEAYNEMVDAGHEVVILSSPWYSNPRCLDAKARTVYKYFGNDARENMVLTKKKFRVICDVLFDDKDGIEKADVAPWAQVIVDGPHNRLSSLPRLDSWRNRQWEQKAEEALLLKARTEFDNGSRIGLATGLTR